MTASFYKKAAALLCLTFIFLSCCVTGYAEPVMQSAKNRDDMRYFEYQDGVVRDGSRNDRAGIIGDEFDYDWQDSSNDMTRSAKEVGDTQRAKDESRAVTFWGIAVSLMVIAAVVLLIALVTPGKQGKNRDR